MTRKLMILFTFFSSLMVLDGGFAQNTYNWPLKPFQQQHFINGTFCENRPSGGELRHHFHNGIDIPLSQGGEVYSVSTGVITTIDPTGTNSYIRIGRFAYVHVDPNPALQVGDQVLAYNTVIGTTNSQNHIHFIDGYYNNETNPLLPNRIDPFTDTYNPVIFSIRFYQNQTSVQFSDNRVGGLVDIVVHAMEKTDNGRLGENNGVYRAGYQIFSEDGVTPIGDPVENFIFTNKPGNQYIKNVYFEGSNLSTYIYIPTNFFDMDGYWNTKTIPFGNYQVEVFVEDTRGNISRKRTSVVVVEQDITPPPAPILSAVRIIDYRQLQISWQPSSAEDLLGYRLYFSFDGLNWNIHKNEFDLTPADSILDISNFTVRNPIYFKITAIDNAPIPNESFSSVYYGLRSNQETPRFLLVNAYGDEFFIEIVKTYSEDIIATGTYRFDSCNRRAFQNVFADLFDYDMIFYFFGDDTSSLSNEEKIRLKSYLQTGGNLMISGSQIATSFFNSDSSFYKEYFKIIADGSLSNVDTIYGTGGQIWSNEIIAVGENSPLPFVNGIRGIDGAEVLVEAQGKTVGVIFRGDFAGGSSPGSIIFLGFPFESISGFSQRADLLRTVFAELSLVTGAKITGRADVPVNKFRISSFPNPFNLYNSSGSDLMTIQYELTASRNLEVDIYNLLGQRIRRLFTGRVSRGIHNLTWDGTNEKNYIVPYGVYFIVLRSDNLQSVQKFLILNSSDYF